jgi:diguanylate cyclase (GGDEF)-like protein/PAS domain S-box-containing protein
MSNEPIKILIVDDDPDDFLITSDLLTEVKEVRYTIEWASAFEQALELLGKKEYDVYLFDYRLGARTGLDLLREAVSRGCRAPIILLTGQGDYEIDLEAIKYGASDYLIKNELKPPVLERAIRYALERRKMEDELFHEKEQAIVALESIGDSVIITNTHGNITRLNRVAENITGWNNQEAQGLSFHDIVKLINEDTHKPVNDPISSVLAQNTIINFPSQTIIQNRDNHEYAIEGTASPIRDREGHIAGIIIVFHDVTSTREMSKKMAYQASHDSLTGLYNRGLFEEHLEQALQDAKNRNTENVLLYLDLDRFKLVNDTCGHFAGDQLLKQAASVMQQKIRHMDIIARLGGDEFGIILTNCPFSKAGEIGEKICQAIRDIHFTWNEKPFSIEVSIGAISINSASHSVSHLLSLADQSCYMAKEKGGNRIHLYWENDSELLERRGEMHWITMITNAFEKDRFRLYYQPIVSVHNHNQPNRYEILIRLIDDDGSIIPPSIFLPATQRYNMMTGIDHWVIETYFAFFQRKFKERQPESIPCCNINLSGATLNDDYFLDFIKEQLKQHQVPPTNICFEITETIAFNNYNKAIQFIKELKELGCLFALDDFGSGLSSFSYLKHLPVDYLKIDGSFVRNMADNQVDRIIVESIAQVGRLMGIQTIAEFVEDEAIFKIVQEIGIDYAQGYWSGKPKPLAEFES